MRYELRSAPGIFVDVPEEYARQAEALVKRTLERPGELPTSHADPSYFGNMGVWARAQSLAREPSSAATQDALFLRVCINRNERAGFGRVGASELDAELVRLVQQVESPEK